MKQFVTTGGSILVAPTIALAVFGAVGFAAQGDLIEDLQNVPGLFPPLVSNVEQCLNLWLTGNRARSRKLASERLSSLLGTKIDELAEVLGLSETERRKLELAGRGDIARFLDHIDEIASEYRSSGSNPKAQERFYPEFGRIRIRLRGAVFDGDSLFAKTLAKISTSAQTARYERFQRDRWLSCRESLRVAVTWLPELSGVDKNRRERLLRLVVEKVPWPRIYGYPNRAAFSDLVLVQMSRLPEESLKTLFDETRWQQLQRTFKHMDLAVERLRENGIILDDDGSLDHKK